MFPYFPETRNDHATLGHSDIINSGLIPTLITSYPRANIYIGSYIQHVSASTTKNIVINHASIYLYIYIHQSRPYQHLITLNHPLVIILLGNSTTNHE